MGTASSKQLLQQGVQDLLVKRTKEMTVAQSPPADEPPKEDQSSSSSSSAAPVIETETTSAPASPAPETTPAAVPTPAADGTKKDKETIINELIQLNAEMDFLFEAMRFRDVRTLIENDVEAFKYFTEKVAMLIRSFVVEGHKRGGDETEKATIIQAVRFLARLIPPLLSTNDTGLIQTFLWQKRYLPITQAPKPPAEGEEPLLLSLAEIIVKTVTSLLFYPRFSVPLNISRDAVHVLSDLSNTWYPGVGVEKIPDNQPTTQMLNFRRDVMKCVMALFSQTLYNPLHHALDNRMLDLFIKVEPNFVKILLYSLINTICSYDPIGWGMPYNHMLFQDIHFEVAEVAVQLLIILLNHYPSGGEPNPYVVALSEIKEEKELRFMFEGIVRIFNAKINAANTYLPGSRKQLGCHQEILIFFWMLSLHNQSFVEFMTKTEDCTRVINPILHIALESRKDDASLGFIHLTVFGMLLLSGERHFAIQLNKPFLKLKTIDIETFNGNFHDFLILVLHKFITDSSPKIEPLHDCMLTIIANLSPYIKSLSMVTTITLMKMFARFSKPKLLFRHESYHRFVQFLLETFNNLIQYQYSGNLNIAYGILSNWQSFTNLIQLKLPDPEPVVEKPVDQDPSSSIVPAESSSSSSSSSSSDPQPIPVAENVATWTPTEEWLKAWKQQLPISTAMRLIGAVSPEISAIVQKGDNAQQQILDYLKNTTLVGVLPVPHPILIRRFQQNQATIVWLHRYLWSVIIVRNRAPPLFGGQFIRLFDNGPQ